MLDCDVFTQYGQCGCSTFWTQVFTDRPNKLCDCGVIPIECIKQEWHMYLNMLLLLVLLQVLGSLTGLTSLRLFMHMPRPELLFPIRSCTSLQRLEVHCHHECIGYSHDPDLQAKGQEVISALSHASTIITVYDKLCDGGRWISWLWQPNVKWVCNNWKYDPWCRRLTPQ